MIVAVALSTATYGQAPAPTETAGAGAISGVVVEAGTSKPVVGAAVTLQGPSLQRGMLTDAKGRFVFSGLAPGTFGILANAIGYLPGGYGNDAPREVGGPIAERRIALRDGQWFSDARVVLSRPSSVSGTVRDDRGDPIVNRFVRLLTMDARGDRPALSVEGAAITDDRGTYAIGLLTPGGYLIVVLPFDSDGLEGMAEGAVAYPRTFFGDTTRVSDATPIVVRAAEDRTSLDVTVQERPARRVAGRVDGAPEAWANLRLALVLPDEPSIGTSTWLSTAWVEADGTFAFPNVPVGRYDVISASWTHYDSPPPNFPMSSLTPWTRIFQLPTDANRRASYSPFAARTAIDVSDHNIDDLVVHLQPGGRISGRIVVSAGSPRAELLRERGALSVGAVPIDGRIGGVPGAQMTGDAFVIDDIYGGLVLLRSFLGNAIKSIVVDGRDMTNQAFDLSGGASYSDAVVTIADLSPLTGVIRRSQQEASRSALVYFPFERDEWKYFRAWPQRFGFFAATSDGRYSAELPGGRYYVVAVPDSWRNRWQSLDFLEAASRVATVVDIEWEQPKTLDLQLQDVVVK